MFVIRNGGTRLVAKYVETGDVALRKTGIVVSLSEELNGEITARPFDGGTAGLKPTHGGFAYIDPQTKSRAILRLGRSTQNPDEFVNGEYILAVTGEGWGMTDQVADGDYPAGALLTADGNSRLQIAADATTAFAKVFKGATVASQNKKIEILFDLMM